MASYPEILASNIERLRKQRGWSQDKVAEEAGIARGTFLGYRDQTAAPSLDGIVKLAKAFKTTPQALISERETCNCTVEDCVGVLRKHTAGDPKKTLDVIRRLTDDK